MLRLIQRKHQIIPVNKSLKIEPNNYGDIMQFEKLKEECSSFIFKEDQTNRFVEGSVIRGTSKPIYERFLVLPSEAYYIAPMFLFQPDGLNHLLKARNIKPDDYFNVNSKIFDNYDPEDNLDDGNSQYINNPPSFFQNFSIFNEKTKEIDQLSDSSKNTGSKIKLKLDLKTEKNEDNQSNKDKLNPFLMEKLDELICYSISQIKESNMRKKMANNILIIGIKSKKITI